MNRVHSYKDPGKPRHPDKNKWPIQEVVDPRGKGQTKRVWMNKEALPAGQGQSFYPEGGTEHLLLHHQMCKEPVPSILPIRIGRETRVQ